jgi:hypothetical protein
MTDKKGKSKEVDAYISAQPPEVQKALNKLRSYIWQAALKGSEPFNHPFTPGKAMQTKGGERMSGRDIKKRALTPLTHFIIFLKTILLGLVLLGLASCGGGSGGDDSNSSSSVINETGFESGADESEYTLSSWEADGFNLNWVQGFNHGRAHIDTAYAQTGNSSLRIDYPAGTVGPYSDGGGAQAPLLIDPREEVYASYWFRVSDNFDWGGSNEGGKLPGLAGGDLCSGGATCDGTNGFSARLMWRPNGLLVLYLYHMDKPGTYGEDIVLVPNGMDMYVQRGQWHHVVERVKINSASNYDGEVQIWIDGEEALLRTGLRFVTNGSLVDTFYFSTFHGGADSSWAPSVDCHIWFDDLQIYY